MLVAAASLGLAVTAGAAMITTGVFSGQGAGTSFTQVLPSTLVAMIYLTAMALTASGCGLLTFFDARGESGPDSDQVRGHLMTNTSVAAGIWTVASLIGLILSYSVASEQPLWSSRFGSDLGLFVTSELGRDLLAVTVIAALTTMVLVARLRWSGYAGVALSLLGIVWLARTGHPSTAEDHETAGTAILVHVLAMVVWMGGLIQILDLHTRPTIRLRVQQTRTLVRAYSRLAGVAWVAIAVSGVLMILVQTQGVSGLSSMLDGAWGRFAAVKIAVVLILAGAGMLQRHRLVLSDGTAILPRLAVAEIAVMVIATGLGALMGRIAPPPAGPPPARAAAMPPFELVTGLSLPPAPTWPQVLLTWRLDLFALVLIASLGLLWWWRQHPLSLSAPGTRHPHRHSSLAFLTGLIVLSVVLLGPIGVYGRVLFSAFVTEHVLLLVVVGPLVSGVVASCSWGSRRNGWWLTAGSGAGAVILAALFFSPLLRWALIDHTGHMAMALLTLSLGIGGAWAVRCASRSHPRAAPALASVLLTLILAVWGGSLVMRDVLIQASFFGATGRVWRADALIDQQQAGIGLIVAAPVLGLVFWAIIRWLRPQPVGA